MYNLKKDGVRYNFMIFCKHIWIKQTEKPQNEYFDYSGVQVGVFSCKCAKCGKVKTRKYMNGYWSELFKGVG